MKYVYEQSAEELIECLLHGVYRPCLVAAARGATQTE